MDYPRPPYGYKPNYAHSAYSGPSTSLRPSFETNGGSGPPSHCDTNEYFSRSQSRSANISSISLPNLPAPDPTPAVRPANLERLIRDHLKTEEGRHDLEAWLNEGAEVSSEYIPDRPKCLNDYIQLLITKAAVAMKNGCQKSKEVANSLGINREKPVNVAVTIVLDEDDEDGWETPPPVTHWRFGVYFFARIDKKLYDAAKATKKAAVRSANFVMGKENKTKSERWQDELNKSYRDMMLKKEPVKK